MGFTKDDDKWDVIENYSWTGKEAAGVVNNQAAKDIMNPSGASEFDVIFQCWKLSKEEFS